MGDSKQPDGPAHATFGASTSERWLNCPGSIALSEKAPPQEETVYAAEGTEGHGCLEYLLDYRGKFRAAIKHAYKRWPKDMVAHGIDAAAWILQTAGYDPSTGEDPAGVEILSESRVDASSFTCEGQFGTLDAAIVEHFGKLTIIDYKYGAGVAVDAVYEDGTPNTQLIYYALGMAARYDFNFTEVELVVIQPRAWHQSGETIRTHRLTIDELEAWIPVFKKGVKRAQKPGAEIKAGKWCRWCPAAVICPKLKDEALKDAQIAFSATQGVKSVREPKMIRPEELGVMLDAADRLETWISQLRDHALYLLRAGSSIPGFKLVEKRAQRKWADENITFAEAMRDFGQRAMKPAELLSPAQLEKALKADTDFKTAKGKAMVDIWISQRTVKESSGTTMAREDDRRVEVTDKLNAREAFKIIDVSSPKKEKSSEVERKNKGQGKKAR